MRGVLFLADEGLEADREDHDRALDAEDAVAHEARDAGSVGEGVDQQPATERGAGEIDPVKAEG